MLTGCQIREVRALLGISPSMLARKSKTVTTQTVSKAEVDDHRPPIAASHMATIRRTLEALGVEFTPENDGGAAGVRLRTIEKGRNES